MKISRFASLALCTVLCILVASCSSSSKTSTTKKTTKTSVSSAGKSSSSATTTAKVGTVLTGQASYYADKFDGNPTASGETFSQKKLTGAHRTLPFGTVVRVTNKANGKSVDIRINDRGPFKDGRIVDLSRAAAEKIDMVKAGVVDVKVTIISLP